MNTIQATVRNGQIELKEPLDLPDGTDLNISIPPSAGVIDDDDGLDPKEIERILVAMDTMIPLQMTDQEITLWEKERLARRESEKAIAFQNAEKLKESWK